MAGRPLPERLRRAWREIAGGSTKPRRQRMAVFSGAQGGRLFADWIASVLSPDDETRQSLRKLRARARDLDRNNGLAHHFFDLLEIHVIGPTGIDLSPQVRDREGNLLKKTNTTIRDAWYRWADGPVSYDETMDLVTLQKLLIRTVAMDGEAFVRIHRDAAALNSLGLYLEPIDADLIDEGFNRVAKGEENEIRLGIEVDQRGRRVAYHLRDPGGYGSALRKPERVPAADMIHVFNPRRVNQTRGVTWLAPSMYALRMEGAYMDAELVGSRLGSSSMGFYYKDMTEGVGGVDPKVAGSQEAEAEGMTEGDFQDEVEPGMFRKLPDGYKFQSFDPEHPTTAFADFVKQIVRRIASGLTAVSYESLSNDRESTSYSSSRTGIMLERDAMKTLHTWWIFMLLRRLHLEFLNWALLTDLLTLESRAAVRYQAAKWMPRGRDWIDPLKDPQAAELSIANGLGSRTRYAAERGLDLEEIFEELQTEQQLAKRLGIRLKDASAPVQTSAQGADGAAGDGMGDGMGDGTGDGAGDGTGDAAAKPREAVLAALHENGSAAATAARR